MNKEQIAYLHARELESFFREKIDLHYCGSNGNFSEYEVTSVNNHQPRRPIKVGFQQRSNDVALYLHADLRKDQQGTARIDFDLSEEKLHRLRTGKDKILFLDSLQTAISKRPLANAEGLTRQSSLHFTAREAKNTLAQPFRQWWYLIKGSFNMLPGGPFGKPFGDTVVQAKSKHILRNALTLDKASLGLRDSIKDQNIDPPGKSIFIRSENNHDFAVLSPGQEYELSFSRHCSMGIPHQKCTFTPVDKEDPRAVSFGLEYNGMQLTRNRLEFYLPSGQTLQFSVSERSKEPHHMTNDTAYHKQQETPIEREQGMQQPSKTSGAQSLDSMIASAQSRAGTQVSTQPIQRDHAVMPGHEL